MVFGAVPPRFQAKGDGVTTVTDERLWQVV
jgi:hypothetical protein